MTDDYSATELRDAELASLLTGVADHNEIAFQRLYHLASPIVYGVLLRVLKIDESAEDALQETFLKVWNKAATYDQNQGKPLTWITSIARYHALDVLRSKNASVLRDDHYASEHALTHHTLQNLSDQVGDGQLLAICLDRLEPEARDCVVNAYCGGYTHQELSDMTGRALGTVKSWIKRSLTALRECVDELS